MATTTANVVVNTTQAQQALTRLNKQVDALGRSFASLGRLVSGLALGGLITNTLRSADAMTDLSAATGLSIAAINGLSSAFLVNGADADTAQTAILKFNDSVTEAAQGSDKTIETFARLGVSLQDIATLSEQDLLRKTIDGLGRMEPGALRTATAMDLFGKAARTVDFTGVNNQLDQFIAKSKEAEPGIRDAAELFDNLQAIGKQFGTEFTKQFQGPIGLLKDLTKNTKTVAENLAILTKIIVAAGAAFLIFSKGIPGLRAINTDIVKLIKAMGGGGSIFKFFSKSIANIGTNIVGLLKNLAGVISLNKIFTTLGNKSVGLLALYNALLNVSRILLRFAGLAGIVYSVVTALDFLTKKIFDFSILDWLADKLSYVGQKFKEFLEFLGFEFDSAPIEEAGEAISDTADQAGQSLEDLYEKNQKFIESVKDITKAYTEQNAEILKTLDTQMKSLHLSDQQIAINKLEDDSIKNLQKTLDDLETKRKEAIQQRNAGGIDNVDMIDREIIAVRKLAQSTLESSKIMTNAYYTELNMIEMRKKALEETNFATQNQLTIQQLEDQILLLGLYGDELEDQTKYLQIAHDLQNAIAGYLEQLNELELQRKENRIGEMEYQREANHIQNMINLSAEYANARIEAEQRILEAQRATQENARLGAEQAIADIAKQFEPYTMAQDAIKAGWSNISSAVDEFVQTGKFKFSDFAKSVIRDLAAMIIKAQIFKAIQATLGLFGFKIPGLATGGPAKAGQPYIVGEKGPELFVPQGSGTVVPNNQLGNKGVATGAVNAPVTNNYITNNISAIDAKGVAQLFAENRKTLLGSVKMAEREMPYMAR